MVRQLVTSLQASSEVSHSFVFMLKRMWANMLLSICRSHAWTTCPYMAQSQGTFTSTVLYSISHHADNILQVGERRIMFIYALLAIMYVVTASTLTIDPLRLPFFVL